MSFVQPWMLIALPLIALPIIIHLINQWRYQTKRWGAMMFLLAANRMNRGFARLRQWLILAMRTLAVAGLIFAVARPLSSGLLAWTGGGRTDTTIVLLDRSPSMAQQGTGGDSKLETARRQLGNALQTLGASHWVSVDASSGEVLSYNDLEALMDSPALQASAATTDLPNMLQAALDHLIANKPGPTEIWICSDLQAADWNSESGSWSLIREGFQQLPQSVRFHLLAYPNLPSENVSVRVTDVKRAPAVEGAPNDAALLLSLRLTRSREDSQLPTIEVPVQIEIEGARSELRVELSGRQTEIRNHRVPLAANQTQGWGQVRIPADENNADNDFYFVFDDPPLRRIVVVSEDRGATRALEVAATVSADGQTEAQVDVLTPQQLDSLVLDNTALLLWQSSLPDASTAPAVENYVAEGGQVMFFPPSSMLSGAANAEERFMGIGWGAWSGGEMQVMVENWRGDQDLLAATSSGAGLPVGQLQLDGFANLIGDTEISKLATLTGGAPLLARVPTAKGGVYFCTVSPDPRRSSLAESGIVLYVAIQRAIERGQTALGNTTQRIAGEIEGGTDQWRQLAGNEASLSTNYDVSAGVYSVGERMFAINRALEEDQLERVVDERVDSLFAGLPFARVDDEAGNLSGIVREIWRLFLIAMIAALLLEAVLCLPRVGRRTMATAT